MRRKGLAALMAALGALTPSLPAAAGEPTGYVALGDSFSSGEGAGEYDPATDRPGVNGCRRSANAYAYEIARQVAGRLPDFVFKACSGATTRDFLTRNPRQRSEPAQLSHLSAATGLVTFSIGGNDIGFTDIVFACVSGSQSCDRTQNEKFAQRLNALEESLKNVYAAIKDRAPEADIVALGYPRFFPADPPPSCKVNASPLLRLQLTRREMLWADQAVDALNARLARAATAAGATFADPTRAFTGHEFCSPAPWFHPLRLGVNGLTRESFHPTPAAQSAFASLIKNALRSRTL